MNDEFQDELNEAIPRVTEEALNSMAQFNQERAYSQQVFAETADQGQGTDSSSSPQTGSKEPTQTQSEQAPD